MLTTPSVVSLKHLKLSLDIAAKCLRVFWLKLQRVILFEIYLTLCLLLRLSFLWNTIVLIVVDLMAL